MPNKRYKAEQIVTLLRQIEVGIANGKRLPLQVCKEAEITVQTYYRWSRKEYGGLKLDQAKRLKELEKENAKLRARGGGTVAGEANSEGRGPGKTSKPWSGGVARSGSPARENYQVSERHAGRLLGPWRGTQR